MDRRTSDVAIRVLKIGPWFAAQAVLSMTLKMPLLIGYIVAGVVIGPFTPGYVADQGLAPDFRELES